MRVRVTAGEPDAFEEPSRSGWITKGREYLVLGLTFEYGDSQWGAAPCVDILLDSGIVIMAVPLRLFEIVDPRVSRTWEVRYWPDGPTVTLWPPAFYTHAFHDRFSNGDPEAVADVQQVVRILEKEFGTE